MERKIIKIIREAFRIAYAKKLLKEDSNQLRKNLSPKELADADLAYSEWVNGSNKFSDSLYRNPKFGPFSFNVNQYNYIIDRAYEDYKSHTNKDKFRMAIAKLFYPKVGSEVYKMFRFRNVGNFWAMFMSDFGKEKAEELLPQGLLSAWAESLVNPTEFQKTVDRYTVEGENGFGVLAFYSIGNKLVGLKKTFYDSSRAGGKAIKVSIDDRSNDENSDFDIEDVASDRSGFADKETMIQMFKAFGESLSNYFNNKGKGTFAKIAKELFINQKTYEEILSDNSNIPSLEGKKPSELSTMILNQVLGPIPVLNLAREYGKKFNLPVDWLENIIKYKKINLISKLSKKDDSWTEPKAKKRDSLLRFESYVENNMDNIIKEVYKRLNK